MAIARNAPLTRCNAGSLDVATIDDGFLAARLIEVALQKFAHFAPAFADERDDVHVGFGVRRHHAQQGGFADAAAGKNAEALAATARHERVNGLDACLKNLVNALALERVRRQQVQSHGLLGLNHPLPVYWPAQAVDARGL